MKRFPPCLLAAALLAALSGCSAAERSRFAFANKAYDYKVTLYSGGQAVRTWHTEGAVMSEERSDGYFLVDKATGKIVEVAGTLVIEQE